jgi:YHS domain-containing protein
MFGFGRKVKDSVCGMKVDPKEAVSRTLFGKTYYFCSEECAKTYESKQSETPGNQSHSAHSHQEGNEHSHHCC